MFAVGSVDVVAVFEVLIIRVVELTSKYLAPSLSPLTSKSWLQVRPRSFNLKFVASAAAQAPGPLLPYIHSHTYSIKDQKAFYNWKVEKLRLK